MARTPYTVFADEGAIPDPFTPMTPPKSALEGALDNKNGTNQYYQELDIVRLILTREIGTKEQHAAIVRIIKQHKPKKPLAYKLAGRLGDNTGTENIAIQFALI